MIITRNLKMARQDRADLDAQITGLRAEGRELLDIGAAQRTPQQNTRLDAMERELTPLTKKAAAVAAEIVTLEREQSAVIASSTYGQTTAAPQARGAQAIRLARCRGRGG